VVSNCRTSELDKYLDEFRLDHTMDLDILSWWKENSNRLPSLSIMARHILSIPMIIVASESSFTMGGRIITKWRSSLKPENAKALLTTRSWVFGFDIEDGKFFIQFLKSLYALYILCKYITFCCKYFVM